MSTKILITIEKKRLYLVLVLINFGVFFQFLALLNFTLVFCHRTWALEFFVQTIPSSLSLVFKQCIFTQVCFLRCWGFWINFFTELFFVFNYKNFFHFNFQKKVSFSSLRKFLYQPLNCFFLLSKLYVRTKKHFDNHFCKCKHNFSVFQFWSLNRKRKRE